jgi:hypothetical protein
MGTYILASLSLKQSWLLQPILAILGFVFGFYLRMADLTFQKIRIENITGTNH